MIRWNGYVNQQHHLLIGCEGLPQFALFDVVFDVMDFFIAQLRITQTRNRIVFIQTLLGFGGGFDVPADQIFAHAKELLEDADAYRQMANAINPFGDGLAAKRIVEIIQKYFITE